ncbi:hypothetical protein EDC94DRAFT_691943 [Helicostylum pulchrum]|uniref:Uncharacterized protein n=1 Tax=Helicostylum pulchrum TaxID=562976 RepID=A0ABP9YBY2_9FUNG|nr:hypothetical protein EDC94DRAFT_691943 [Helicostylum pulchrum]
MKFVFALASVFVLSQLVSGQSPACTAQEVLTTCLSTEDIYLKTCTDQDYACLCKWHTAKLSCFDSCPQDVGRPFVQGSKDTFCSIAKTYNTTASSAVLPSVAISSQVVASNSASVLLPSHSASSNTTTASTSMSTSSYGVGQSVFMVVAGITTWFLT